ncbi:GAF domain-containing protein [Pedobacter sp. BS3]|uniref:GAF domain-containing protein n=1 Tax=Pedobacter sp. BS3 TaxID=2567937 RepID=UPI0011EFF051|nr:GAF domain-containing protein [Pedobacter sp. BS3]TZF81498.1 GAF domain-containing protein [Pedobacter sp. BS3]
MAEDLNIISGSREDQYRSLYPQVTALLNGETSRIANMANVCAALKEQFGFFWVGFYLVEGDELVLGPFQGTVACTRIARGKGVCGTAWQQRQNIIVPDVDQFPGHIACSSLSRSEIVIPVFNPAGEVIAILDVDSEFPDFFDETDRTWLEKFASLIL